MLLRQASKWQTIMTSKWQTIMTFWWILLMEVFIPRVSIHHIVIQIWTLSIPFVQTCWQNITNLACSELKRYPQVLTPSSQHLYIINWKLWRRLIKPLSDTVKVIKSWVIHQIVKQQKQTFNVRLPRFVFRRNCLRDPEDMYSVMKTTWNKCLVSVSIVRHLFLLFLSCVIICHKWTKWHHTQQWCGRLQFVQMRQLTRHFYYEVSTCIHGDMQQQHYI